MRGPVWFVLVSLPTAMISALGLFLIVVAICARAVSASPFGEVVGLAMAAAMVPEAKSELLAALARLQGALVAWEAPIGAFASVVGGLVGAAVSRDIHRSWFALVPLLMVWALPLRSAPWTVLVVALWVAAALAGALLVPPPREPQTPDPSRGLEERVS